VTCQSVDGKLLLGDVKIYRSSRFQRRLDAELLLAAVIEINSHTRCSGRIIESTLSPEIFVHCEGAMPQAIGGFCSRCGVRLSNNHAQVVADQAMTAYMRNGGNDSEPSA